jgi:hypothetical protein
VRRAATTAPPTRTSLTVQAARRPGILTTATWPASPASHHVLIEIARRLDLHPADLVPELEPLLSHRRQPQPPRGTGTRQRRPGPGR